MSWKVLDFKNNNFEAILGQNVLYPIGAKIDLLNNELIVNNVITKFNNNSCPFKYDEIYSLDSLDLNYTELFEKLKHEELNNEELKNLKNLIYENKDLFYREGDKLTAVNEIKHQIITTNSQPIYSKMYRFPKIHEEEVNTQVREMLKQNIIQPSNSPYNSPVWVVPKKMDNSGKPKWRVVIDYRKLNEITVDDRFPIPNIESIFDKLGRAQYFTTLDLAKGFYQILVDEKDRPKTAFSTPQGHYEYIRMPFGLKNAPATFQRMMNHVLRDEINKSCVVYLDDILIFSTSLQEHLVAIRKIFEKLRKHNLKIQVDKCKFFAKQTEYLGHTLTTEGIKPNDKKIEAIKQIKLPTTPKQIKSFLGVTGYYRKFIKDYAKVAQPMTRFLKKKYKLDVNDTAYKESFQKLKELITSHPVLKYPDFKKKFILTTDASYYAIGAVLSQEEHPVAFASRTLNEHEINYSTIEKELLAIIWATKYFRPYLFGNKFTVRTDHQPLKWLNSLKEPNDKMQRWRISLNEYDFDIEYIKGKENKVADFLSRFKLGKKEIEIHYYEEDIELVVNNVTTKFNDPCPYNFDEINHLERSDSEMATIHSGIENQMDDIPIKENVVNKYLNQIHLVKEKENEFIIKYKNFRQIYISENDLNNPCYLNDVLRRLIRRGTTAIFSELEDHQYNLLQNKLKELFSNDNKIKFVKCVKRAIDLENEEGAIEKIKNTHLESNHRGIIENYNELKDTIFFPKLKELIQKYINNCDICNLAKFDRNPNKYKFELTETPNEPNEILHGDLFFCYKEVYLTLVDKFSKHLMTQRCNDRNAITLIQLLKNRFSIFGKPKKIVFDNEFDSLNLKDFLRQENIDYHFCSPRSHTGNSTIERLHGTLCEHLRIFEAQNLKMSPLEKVLLATEKYNNSIHSVTGVKPIDFINNKVPNLETIRLRIETKKKNQIDKLNETRKPFDFKDTDSILVENPEALRYKHKPKYTKIKVKFQNKKYKDQRNRNIHISRIKRNFKFSGKPNNNDGNETQEDSTQQIPTSSQNNTNISTDN
jgi:hypothetical protein